MIVKLQRQCLVGFAGQLESSGAAVWMQNNAATLETLCQFLESKNTYLSYDPGIQLLHSNPK